MILQEKKFILLCLSKELPLKILLFKFMLMILYLEVLMPIYAINSLSWAWLMSKLSLWNYKFIIQQKKSSFVNVSRVKSSFKFGMNDVKSTNTAMSSICILEVDDRGKSIAETSYHGMNSSLLYRTTRWPNIFLVPINVLDFC